MNIIHNKYHRCNCPNCELRRQLTDYGLKQRLNRFYQKSAEDNKRQQEIQKTDKLLRLTDRQKEKKD